MSAMDNVGQGGPECQTFGPQRYTYLSPDCRDGNHTKCDTVAWDALADNYTTCGCDCQHYGRGPE